MFNMSVARKRFKAMVSSPQRMVCSGGDMCVNKSKKAKRAKKMKGTVIRGAAVNMDLHTK